MRPTNTNRGLFLGLLFEQAKARYPDTFVELDRGLEVWPERGQRLSYAELADLVDDAAARLNAAGIRQDDRVAVYKNENFDIVLLACSLSRIGALPVMLSPALAGDTVAALLDRLDQPHLITDPSRLDRLVDAKLERITSGVVLAAGQRDGLPALAEFSDAPRPVPVRMHPDQPAIVTHTSGTTGLPKMAVQTAQTLWWRFRPQSLMTSVLRRRETVAFCLSFVHSRMYSGLGVILHRGLPAVVLADPSPKNVASVFAKTKPSVVETFPNCFITWEELADDPRAPLSNVVCYCSTFDALHPRTVRRLLGASRRRLPVMVQLYGQSETGPVAVRMYTKRSAKKADGRCLGFSMPGLTRVRAHTDNGKRATADHPGFIEATTGGRALTYLSEEDRFAHEVHGSWWRMGDMGYRTWVGCVHVLDRHVDQIPDIPSNLQIEDILLDRLPELTEVIVIPDAEHRPVPVVCTRGGQPLDDRHWTSATVDLPPLAPPIHRNWSALPRTSTWKIKRLELATRLREEQTGAPND
jgi:acyl-coenzyme A synthetase/AMP-(fatty) acid ligase